MALTYATYLTAADINAELKNINFTTNTNITAATLDDLTDRTQAIVDGMLSARYIVPVIIATAPASALILKEICAKLGAAHVDEILRQTGIKTSAEMQSKISKLKSDALAMLQEIKEDRLVLYDAVRKTPIDQSITGSPVDTTYVPVNGLNSILTGNLGATGTSMPDITITGRQW
jgi:hypothetical protein